MEMTLLLAPAPAHRWAGLGSREREYIENVRRPGAARAWYPRGDAKVVYELERRASCRAAPNESAPDWLLEHRVTRVAMESTGVYWESVNNLLRPSTSRSSLSTLSTPRQCPA